MSHGLPPIDDGHDDLQQLEDELAEVIRSSMRDAVDIAHRITRIDPIRGLSLLESMSVSFRELLSETQGPSAGTHRTGANMGWTPGGRQVDEMDQVVRMISALTEEFSGLLSGPRLSAVNEALRDARRQGDNELVAHLEMERDKLLGVDRHAPIDVDVDEGDPASEPEPESEHSRGAS